MTMLVNYEQFSDNFLSITQDASTASATTKTARKAKSSPIMLVVIVLAVLLAACICTVVGVFCWFSMKSGWLV